MLRVTLALAIFLLASCDADTEPDSDPSGPALAVSTTGVERCFTDGRHLGVESSARSFIADYLNPHRVALAGYEVGATLAAPTDDGARFEMEYIVHGASGATVPMLFVATVVAETCEATLVEVNGHPAGSYTRPTPTPATGEHCVDILDKHLGFEGMVRDAVTERLALEGARIGSLSMSSATIRPAQAGWHPYEARVQVYVDVPGSITIDSRTYYAQGAINADTCKARLDSLR